MSRYFFDFNDVPDVYGIDLPSAGETFGQALESMPEYVADLLMRDRMVSEITCTIREDNSGTIYKIVMSVRVEDGAGASIAPPFHIES